jgi:hypothetical protein
MAASLEGFVTKSYPERDLIASAQTGTKPHSRRFLKNTSG